MFLNSDFIFYFFVNILCFSSSEIKIYLISLEKISYVFVNIVSESFWNMLFNVLPKELRHHDDVLAYNTWSNFKGAQRG